MSPFAWCPHLPHHLPRAVAAELVDNGFDPGAHLTEATRIGTANARVRLNAGADTNVRVTSQLPATIDPDDYYLFVQIDPEAVLQDENPDNHLAQSEGTFSVP